jgi:hypothetical protein
MSVVPAVLAALAVTLLITCVVLAFVSVSVDAMGDSTSFECRPIGGNNDALDCSRHIENRLQWAVLAGMGAGVLAVTAFAVERGANSAARLRRTTPGAS